MFCLLGHFLGSDWSCEGSIGPVRVLIKGLVGPVREAFKSKKWGNFGLTSRETQASKGLGTFF